MTRHHARPMSAHERARRIRGTAYVGAEAVVFIVAVLAVLALAAVIPNP